MDDERGRGKVEWRKKGKCFEVCPLSDRSSSPPYSSDLLSQSFLFDLEKFMYQDVSGTIDSSSAVAPKARFPVERLLLRYSEAGGQEKGMALRFLEYH